MAGGCFSLTCSDICRCITFESTNGSITITKDGNNCTWDLSAEVSNITATFDDSTRQLCLQNNGNVLNCVTIPDSDDQYITLTGTILEIHKSDGTIVNSIDLAGIIPPETVFSLSSSTLQVTPGGVHGHSPTIELIPSSDANNILIIGLDGRPYVPPSTAQTNVVINAANCISFTKQIVNGTITFTPVVDFTCLAAQICPICKECLPAAISITDIDTNSFRLYVSNLAVGDTFDISLNGGTTYSILGLSASPYIVAGLNDNTTYNVVVRHHCALGGSAITNIQTITTDLLLVCDSVSNILITYGSYDFATATYPVTMTWDVVPNAVSYVVTDNASGVIGTVTTNLITFNVAPSTSFSGTIQTNCGLGGNSSPAIYADISPIQAVCPPPTNLVVTIS